MNMANREGQIGPPRYGIAVQALVWLSHSEKAVSSGSIACQVNSHATFLRRVMIPLVQAGLVEAKEGRDGGYRLNRRADRITLADIYLAVKTEPAEMEDACGAGDSGENPNLLENALEEIMLLAEQKTVDLLKRYTLEDMIKKSNTARENLKL